jgi:hypothetical protein
MAPLTRLACVALFGASGAAHAQVPCPERDGGVCNAADAVARIFSVAGEVRGFALGCTKIQPRRRLLWQIAADEWLVRNRDYLDAATRIATAGATRRFEWDIKALRPYVATALRSAMECANYRDLLERYEMDATVSPVLQPALIWLGDERS